MTPSLSPSTDCEKNMDTLLKWLEDQELSEILEQNDLTEVDVLYILYCHGHLALPTWLDDEMYDGEYDE